MDEDIIRQGLRDQIKEDGVECLSCGGTSFDIEVWDVGDLAGVPRGAAICTECGSRLNIRMTESRIEEIRES